LGVASLYVFFFLMTACGDDSVTRS
jgi:hypothetical protein